MSARRATTTNPDARLAAREIHAAIGHEALSLVIFFVAPGYDQEALGDELGRLFAGVPMVGSTTAGEITDEGYLHGALTAVGLTRPDFDAVTVRLDDLAAFEFARGEALGAAALAQLGRGQATPDGGDTFAMLLIDGLSMKEEPVVASIYRSLGDIQLFGGSAGDGTRFGETWVFHEGRFRRDCAVLTLIRTERPFTVFKTQHFESSSEKMVVTEADPARRVVTEINGVPAGREYARMVGLDVDELTPLIFSTYPVVVRLGGHYYVRSIQKVNADESLSFFCAIDEGIVLTVARGVDLVDNLRATFRDVEARIGKPELVLGCDCVLRDLEIEQRDLRAAVSAIMIENHVIGFSTYGEQWNSMHVNQTFTGVAIGARRHG